MSFKKVVALGVGIGGVVSAYGAAKPNVLFIAVDDLKPILGCYGDSQAITPNIDRIAEKGMVFTNNHCQYALCGPTRASLLSGLRPDTIGCVSFKTKMRDLKPNLTALPQDFKNNGYFVTGIGKIYDYRCCDGMSTQDKASWSEPFTPTGLPKHCIKENKKLKTPTECADVPDNTYNDGLAAELAIKKLKKLAKMDKPFFLAVGFKKPHLPFSAPKKYWDMYDRDSLKLAEYQKKPVGAPQFALQDSWEMKAYNVHEKPFAFRKELQKELIHGYYAATTYMDAQLGKVLDELKSLGLENNTIIILWGDHGWHLGDHGMWCKHTNYEQATRSPLIISYPGMKNAGTKSDSPVEHIDIFPTLIELAGLEKPTNQELEGTSLVPILKDPKASVSKLAISQFTRNDKGVKLMGYTYRGKRYRYTQWLTTSEKGQTPGQIHAEELYDYVKDPLETRNEANNPEYKDIVERFKKEIANGYKGLVSSEDCGL